MRGSDEREVTRSKYADSIPTGYRWWLHLLVQFAVGYLVFLYASYKMSGWSYALVPPFLLLANFIEWYYHKNVMHHVFWGLKFATREHVGEHHSMFIAGDMEVRELRELHAVLLAPMSLGVAYGIMLVPALVMYAVSPPIAYAWVAASAIYLVSYEILHTVYHLPLQGRFARPFRWLRQRHERHHDPQLMQRYNFNVTVPIWDVLLGTYKG